VSTKLPFTLAGGGGGGGGGVIRIQCSEEEEGVIRIQ
jgi:hypothetical protein